MAAIINADDGVISGASGLKLSSDTSGALNIQTNGVTAIAISASQAVSFPATTSLNFTSANITTLTSSSATITNLIATTASISDLSATVTRSASGTITNLLATTATISASTYLATASGSVGIGTTSPGAKLEIKGSNNEKLIINADLDSANYQNQLSFKNNGTQYAALASGKDSGNNSVGLVFYTGTSERMRLDASGNLLVGTTSGTGKVRIESTGVQAVLRNTSASGYTSLRLYNDQDSSVRALEIDYFGSSASGGERAEIFATGAYHLAFGTSNTERARILSDGKFCIGDTSSNYLLRVGGAINNNAKIGGLTIGQSASEYPSAGYNVRFTTTINTYNYDGSDFAAMIRYAQNDGRIETFTAASGTGGNQITFTTGPYVANLGTSWTNSSDERLKNITGEIQNGLAKVCSLRAAEFTWKTGGTGKQQVGLIAQDVLNVLPEVVVIPDAEFDGTAGTAMGVNYDQTIPLLVAAIKELKSELDQLKGKL